MAPPPLFAPQHPTITHSHTPNDTTHLHHLLVRHQVPAARGREPGVRLFNAADVVHLFEYRLDVLLDALDRRGVGAQAVVLEEGYVRLVERLDGRLLLLDVVVVLAHRCCACVPARDAIF